MAKRNSKTSQQPEPTDWRRQAREIADSLAIAFILAMVIRHFCLEVFKIPTKSMQPTLLGDPWRGDKILVNKFAYDFRGPRRWDVIVFKYPVDTTRNYIKRVIGLPGETIFIRAGNVFVRRPGSTDWEIARKPWRVQRALWRPRVVRSEGGSFWVPDDPSHWTIDDEAFAVASSPRGPPQFLRFQRPILAYEDREFRESKRPFERITTSDIMVQFRLRLEPHSPEATVDVAIDVSRTDYLNTIDEWTVRLPIANGTCRPEILRDAKVVETGQPCTLRPGRESLVQVCHVDQTIIVRVGDREVVNYPYEAKVIEGFFTEGEVGPSLEAKTRIGCAGALSLRQPAVYVDVHYTTKPSKHAVLRPFTIGADEYFVCGDNSANSNDSREWGIVPRRYLVGEAFLVLWPLGRMKLVR